MSDKYIAIKKGQTVTLSNGKKVVVEEFGEVLFWAKGESLPYHRSMVIER